MKVDLSSERNEDAALGRRRGLESVKATYEFFVVAFIDSERVLTDSWVPNLQDVLLSPCAHQRHTRSSYGTVSGIPCCHTLRRDLLSLFYQATRSSAYTAV